MKIKNIKKINYSGDVYNLRIKEGNNILNNYYANNLCVSNCHKAKAKTLTDILERTFGNAEYRVGFSGTFPDKDTAELQTIESNVGPILLTVKATELMKKGLISNIKIKALILQYEDKDFASNVFAIKKRGGGKKAYDLEKKYAQNSKKRLSFINKLVDRFKNNSLLLFHNIEYGQEIYNYLRSNCIGKNIYYIDGSVDAAKRTSIKKIMEDTSGNVNILVASFGTLSTGVNIKAINNIVFADSFKSDQIIRQSIGRGLRLHDEKQKLIVFDLVDQFHHAYKNTLYNHYQVRKEKIYNKQGFPLDEIKIVIK